MTIGPCTSCTLVHHAWGYSDDKPCDLRAGVKLPIRVRVRVRGTSRVRPSSGCEAALWCSKGGLNSYTYNRQARGMEGRYGEGDVGEKAQGRWSAAVIVQARRRCRNECRRHRGGSRRGSGRSTGDQHHYRHPHITTPALASSHQPDRPSPRTAAWPYLASSEWGLVLAGTRFDPGLPHSRRH